MHTVLVTGAEGFAGSRLVSRLQKQGLEVITGVRNRARKLIYERRGIRALVCDVADAITTARVIAAAQPDAVAHLAGPSPAEVDRSEPLVAYQSTVTAWANVLDGARRAVPRARVLLVSSAAVYGAETQDGAVSETFTAKPLGLFGEFKHLAEEVAAVFHRNYQMDVAIARPFRYTGPGEPERFPLGALVRRLAAWDPAIHGRDLPVEGLNIASDWLHVDDLVEAYARILSGGPPHTVYNICSGKTVMFGELVRAMLAELGLELNLTEAPQGYTVNCPIAGDPGKLGDELAWSPERTAEAAVRELVRSYRHAAEPVTR